MHSFDFPMRDGQPADDAPCGRIIAAASMASPLPERLPHAPHRWSNASPLAPEGRRRVIAEQRSRVVGFADHGLEPLAGREAAWLRLIRDTQPG